MHRTTRGVSAREGGSETVDRAGVRLEGVHNAPAHARTARDSDGWTQDSVRIWSGGLRIPTLGPKIQSGGLCVT